MPNVTLSQSEARQIDKAIRLLRDRYYSYYHNAKNQESEKAQENLRTYEQLDSLRWRISSEVNQLN